MGKKEFKRCPRCNTKTFINLTRCGNCGLNYNKFNSATNAEAKSAFRMGEKNRVLYTKTVPSDISKPKMFFKCLLGGWFGLHYFSIGKIWRGIVQILGLVLAYAYSYGTLTFGITSGYLGYLLIIGGMVWVYTFITWLSDCFAILFNKFKYPVSLPYSNAIPKKITNTVAKPVVEDLDKSITEDKQNPINDKQNSTEDKPNIIENNPNLDLSKQVNDQPNNQDALNDKNKVDSTKTDEDKDNKGE